jgi:hypothetical protein
MKTHRFILAALIASFAFALSAHAAESISIRALLIMASNSKAPADPKLAAFEAELQRNFPESSFRLMHEGSATVADNGRASISLGSGDTVEAEARRTSAGIQMKLNWAKGEIATTVVQQAGIPAVLIRRPVGDGKTPIVLVIAK